MKTETINLYSIEELKQEFPDAYEHVIEEERTRRQQDHARGVEDITESFKAVFDAFDRHGVTLADWSIGCRSTFAKVSLSDGLDEMSHRRRITWLYSILADMGYFPSGSKTPFPGLCKLTGVCYDDDFLESLWLDVKAGYALKDSFVWLADKAEKMIDIENEYWQSEDCIFEDMAANGYLFEADGKSR